MDGGDGGGGGNRAEAERWLQTANKLLSARDLQGARSFAIRARESDPSFGASEQLLTVIDTVLAGESRINDSHRDWYGILQSLRYSSNMEHIGGQYRRLALLLDPQRNLFALASHAFSLVHDAWSLLSNPAKKALYDSELRLLTTPTANPRSTHNSSQSTRPTRPLLPSPLAPSSSNPLSGPHSCRRGFHAVVIRSPPPPLSGKDASYCSWGFFPLGFSGNSNDVNGVSSNWNPFSPLFPCPLRGAAFRKQPRRNWDYYDDEAAAAFIEFSDPSDDDSGDGDWMGGKIKARKKARVSVRKNSGHVRKETVERPRRGARKEHQNGGSGDAAGSGTGASALANSNGASGVKAESGKKAAVGGSRRRGAGNLGKLDLNVEFSNEVEEPSRGVRDREGNAAGHAEDNIEGIGFFEGLDEFLSSLPILNVVADDKVKGH
ncbi:hypothetical protein Fmac_005119 [Flemingia macrophylla]|uniref:J domain-containing protein n=1 Tax=Flemingia macrophylla TaxID=520843 RepID=A0ABD1N6W4_9FABA